MTEEPHVYKSPDRRVAECIEQNIKKMKLVSPRQFPYTFRVVVFSNAHLDVVNNSTACIGDLIIGDTLVDSISYDVPPKLANKGDVSKEGCELLIRVVLLDNNAEMTPSQMQRLIRHLNKRMHEKDGEIEYLRERINNVDLWILEKGDNS